MLHSRGGHHHNGSLGKSRGRKSNLSAENAKMESVMFRRYAGVIMTVEELRMSIERHLDQVSDEAERLRAALDALGPDDTSSSTGEISRARGSRPRRIAPGGATEHALGETRSDRLAPAIGASAGTAVRRPKITASLSHPPSDMEGTAEESAAGSPSDEQSASATGAERALRELRSELTAALRTSRREWHGSGSG